MKHLVRCVHALSLILFFTFGSIQIVGAQEADGTDFMLEAITVTAQKREENQQKVPIAMDIVSGDKIKNLGQNDVDEILSSVSNAIINKAEDGLRISLRGISDDQDLFLGQHVSTPSVSVNLDGVYNNRGSGGQGLYDVERVEVLFGPQSTMYASTTPGGIVNVITSQPKIDIYEGSGLVEYGNYNLLHTEGSANVPIIENVLAVRTAFSTSVHEGYVSNGADGEDSKSARLKILYQPHENLSVTITGEYGTGGGYGIAGVEAFMNQDDVDDPWTSNTDLGYPSSSTDKKLNGRIDWDLGFGSLAIVPSITTDKKNQTSVMTEDDVTTTDHSTSSGEQKGMELRMVSSEDFFFTWITGFNYYNSEDSRYSYTDESSYTSESTNTIKTKALFGNITYPIAESFRITGGARYTWDSNHTWKEELNKPTEGGTEDRISDSLQEYNNPDTKIGLEIDLSEDSMFYADRSTSYRTQGKVKTNARGETPPPEKLTAYSIGVKNRFFNNKLQLNSSAYFYQYKNRFANQMKSGVFDEADINYDLNGDGDIEDTDIRISDGCSSSWGDFRSFGADVQLTAVISSDDVISLSVSYLNAKFDDLYFDYEYEFFEDEDYSGEPNTYSPRFNISGSYSHTFSLPNGGNITTLIDSKYQSSYIVSWQKEDDPYRKQEPHHISNISATYEQPDSAWSLTGYVKNIENYAAKRSYMGSNLIIGSPRTYGAVFSIKY